MQRKNHQGSSKKSKRYSEAFKRKVISDIQDGIYSPWRAMQIYGIGGKMTIYKWLLRYDPNHSGQLSEESRYIGMKKKGDSILHLKERIRYLEKLVSDLSIEKKILEMTIDIANETYSLDLKKNLGKRSLDGFINRGIKRSQ